MTRPTRSSPDRWVAAVLAAATLSGGAALAGAEPPASQANRSRTEVEGGVGLTTRSHPVSSRGQLEQTKRMPLQLPATPTDALDLAAMEARIEALRAQLDGLERIEGSYTTGGTTATWLAFVEGDRPVVVVERWDLGDHGAGEAVFHFADGELLRYRSRTRVLSVAGAPSDGWYERTMTMYFRAARFVGGFGRVDRRSAEPDEHEVRGAWRQGQAVRDRVASARTAGVATVEPDALRYACENGAVFAVDVDRMGRRAVVHLPDREPLSLAETPMGTGVAYADDAHQLRVDGEQAQWQVAGEAPVRCTIAPSSWASRASS